MLGGNVFSSDLALRNVQRQIRFAWIYYFEAMFILNTFIVSTDEEYRLTNYYYHFYYY